jgi:hypothetical protein
VAREILRRSLDNWRHAELLIPREALELIHACCEDLRRLSAEELELLFRSALDAGYQVGYWFARAHEAGVDVDAIAREGLQIESFRTRAAAVEALGRLGERFVDDLVGVLGDDYPQVRVAAIHALERLRPNGAWREHLQYECYVPAGPFVMGDDGSDQSDEKPAHEVHLDAYYIGRYPVTNADYKQYKDDVGQPFDIPEGKADHPVATVNWYHARDYAAWAGMRLLTEAEWEKAASWDAVAAAEPLLGSSFLRSELQAAKRTYPWGDEFDKEKCNTNESGIGTTTPVGEYSPQGDSPYGCADMAGNVWEWTSSLRESYPYRADDGREDMSSDDRRVLRGGSFYSTADSARCASRNRHNFPLNRIRNFGFRVGVGVVAAPFSPTSGL